MNTTTTNYGQSSEEVKNFNETNKAAIEAGLFPALVLDPKIAKEEAEEADRKARLEAEKAKQAALLAPFHTANEVAAQAAGLTPQGLYFHEYFATTGYRRYSQDATSIKVEIRGTRIEKRFTLASKNLAKNLSLFFDSAYSQIQREHTERANAKAAAEAAEAHLTKELKADLTRLAGSDAKFAMEGDKLIVTNKVYSQYAKGYSLNVTYLGACKGLTIDQWEEVVAIKKAAAKEAAKFQAQLDAITKNA
jgi:hypothetical protein